MADYTGLEIAIIGMSGRFPDADNVEAFWQNLAKGHESVRFFTPEELLENGIDPEEVNDPDYVRANVMLEGKEYFDAEFFQYRPDEAHIMDPQTRLFHEVVWEALEDAGCNHKDEKQRIGLFAGSSINTNWSVYSHLANQDEMVDSFSAFNLSNPRFLSSLISYYFNLKGPSVYIDTACSTALVAVHQACNSLLLGNCNVAMAGGVTVTNSYKEGHLYQEGMIYSKDGHCRTFDAQASGTIAGEGAGVVVLKTLKNALKDGDHIHAIIRGSGINNDGRDKVGYTTPSVAGQAETIITAQKWAKIPAESISYIEAHGTATPLGDPIEVEALNRAFGHSTKKHCALGSVKSNIGHLDVAAGIAGLIKTVLALKHKQLPPSLHFEEANPKIKFNEGPFYVNNELTTWKNGRYPRRAGVSSFGIGGTNAHVVLEEAPEPKASSASRNYQLLQVSAKTPAALERNAQTLAKYLEGEKDQSLADIAYTLQTGRTPLAYRGTVVCLDRQEGISLLKQLKPSKKQKVQEGVAPSVVFMFSGQGSQYSGMYKDLYEREEIFTKTLNECFNLAAQAGNDLKALLFQSEEGSIDQTEYTQPLLFAVEYALARQMMNWGLQPNQLIGHSIGEYAAACISSIFSLEDAMKLVIRRGQLMQSAPGGSMLSVGMREEDLNSFLQAHQGLNISAINTSDACVVSGNDEDIKTLSEALKKAGHESRTLRTSHAFHSPMMGGILEDFRKELDQITFNEAKIPIVNNIQGEVSRAMEAPQYWVDQIVSAVNFSSALNTLLSAEPTVFIELGPGKSLSTFVRSHGQYDKTHQAINMVRHPKEDINDQATLLKGLGAIWQTGVAVDWEAYYEAETRNKVSLPTYSFEKTKFPVYVSAYQMISEKMAEGQGKQSDIGRWLYEPSWKAGVLKGKVVSPKGGVLVFADASGIGNALAERYRKAGCQVTTVQAGAVFQADGSEYQIRPGEATDLEKLFTELKTSGFNLQNIIHAWGIESEETQAEERYFYSLFSILKSCQSAFGLMDKSLSVITRGMQQVMKEALADSAAKSLTLGLLKVVSQEYPNLHTSHIDLEADALPKGELIEDIYNEQLDKKSSKEVTFRMGIRFERTYDRLKTSEGETATRGFRKEGVYIITGGLGQLGYHLSRHLLQNYQAKVVLLGRTDVNALSQKATQANGSAIKASRLTSLEGLPGEVIYAQCDVANAGSLAKVIIDVEEKWGRVNGVVHAAGIVQGHTHTLNELTEEQVKAQLQPKVEGLQVLHAQFENRHLDFCLLTSSLASVLGGIGFGAYAPANSYMDHFVRETGAKRWISVNLDGLSFDKKANDSISTTELMTVFDKVLALEDTSQVVVSVTPLAERLEKWIDLATDNEDTIERIEQEETEAIHNTEARLLKLWKDFYGKSDLEADDDFFEVGGDSLKALTMIGRIHKLFGLEIPIREFFNRPTVAALSAYIDEKKAGDDLTDMPAYEPIPKAEAQPSYPMSSAQKRLYFLWEFDRDSLAYNTPEVLRLKGVIDPERMELVFMQLLQRHESLRTAFEVNEGSHRQRILSSVDFAIESYSAKDSETDAIINAFARPFDLSAPPLLRVGLIALEDKKGEYLFLIDIHHIVTDGVSMSILTEEFMALYGGQKLPELKLSYTDFADWQQSEAQQKRIEAQREFWLNQFDEVPPVIELPIDRTRPVVKSHLGSSVMLVLDKQQTNQLKAISEQEGATLFMILLSIYNVFLSKLSNQTDIVVGTPIAGRPHPDLENIMGLFASTLPLRNQVDGSLSFIDLLAQVKASTLNCFDNQEYPYEEMIDQLQVNRDISRNPLFDVMFSYLNAKSTKLEIPAITLSHTAHRHEKSQFDLTLIALEFEEQLELRFEYATALFDHSSIVGFANYFQAIVDAVLAKPMIKFKEISLVSEREKEQLLSGFNNTRKDLGTQDKTLPVLLDACAKANGNNTALTFEGESITYLQLNKKSNALAHTLIDKGLKPQDRVGILVPRSIEMMVSILAVLKAGACYIPLDPDYPEERIRYIVEDSGLVLLLTGHQLADSLVQSLNIQSLSVTTTAQWSTETTLPKVELLPENLAYLIYTSGSTGKPKGVMIEHHSVINFIYGVKDRIAFDPSDSILCLTTISFDIFVLESLLPLLTGMRIALASAEDQRDPNTLLQMIGKEKLGMVQITPSHLRMLISQTGSMAALQGVHTLMVGGEALPSELLLSLKEVYQGKLYNMYGPTETTVWSGIQELTDATEVNIGKPIANTIMRIVDNDLQIQPIGIAGELCIGGHGLARGYWNRNELTEEKFVADPYAEGEFLYKTGDLARWLPNGDIEYISRKDDQVKIRGYRIEPGEIEALLASHQEVNQAVVLVRELSGDKQLISYYQSDNKVEAAALRDYLAEHLPGYMIPTYFVSLPSFPLTPNNKVNKRALPDPKMEKVAESALPKSKLESKLLDMWKQVLHIEEVGTDMDFFMVGGTSLKLIELFQLLDVAYPNTVKVRTLFEKNTIRLLAKHIETKIQPIETPSKKKKTKIEF